jgi:ADP-heptose:LPS heptosyltransferase
MEHFVLIRPGALGDALLTIPALALLRLGQPDAHVTFVARRDVLTLLAASGLVDATASYDSPAWAALFADELAAASEARQIVAGSSVVAWIAGAEGAVARSLMRLDARRVVVRPGRPSLRAREHMALYLAHALHPLGVPVPAALSELIGALPALHAPAPAVAAAAAAWHGLALPEGRRVVGLHAGSGGAAKRWPPAAFAAAAEALHARGAQPLLIEGPQDAAVTAALRAVTGDNGTLPVLRGLSVDELASVLRRCAAYLGNDSGVTHLAALMRTPVVALFGPSDPTLWMPLGTQVRVLRSATGAVADIAPAAAVEAVWELLRSTAK